MLHSETDEKPAVQTSLNNTSTEKSVLQELEQLREDKSILEGKIRGYLTLSDICHEYKAELAKLHLEYNQLQEKFSQLSMETTKHKPPHSESPTCIPDDLGANTRHDLDNRNDLELQKADLKSLSIGVPTVGQFVTASNIARKSPISHSKETVATPGQQTFTLTSATMLAPARKETVAMQESLLIENEHLPSNHLSMSILSGITTPSAASLGGGFVHVTRDKQAAVGEDLMYFSHAGPSSIATPLPPLAQISDEEKLESLASLLTESPGTHPGEDLSKIVTGAVNKFLSQNRNLEEQAATLKESNSILIGENQKLKKELKHHLENVTALEERVTELRSRQPALSLSPMNTGWVQVEATNTPTSKVGIKENFTSVQTGDIADFQALRDQNKQLLDANNRWVTEWDKLQTHFQGKVGDLQTQRDKLARRVTDLQIQGEQRQVESEKTNGATRKALADEETAKGEAIHQLNVANNRVDTLQDRIEALESQLTDRNRDNQALTAELSVFKKAGGSQIEGRPHLSRPPAGESSEDLQTVNEVLRQQLLVFHEDFDRERHDRADAQSMISDMRKSHDLHKRRILHLEQNIMAAERKANQSEENLNKVLSENGRLQKETAELQTQIRRDREANSRPYIAPYGVPQPPIIQSAGLHQQSPAYQGQLFPQQPLLQQSPQPQQHVVRPLLNQPVQQYTAGLHFLNVAASQLPVSVPGAQYYQASQAGSQNEQLPGAWPCNSCTYVNYPGRTVCEMCGYVQTHNPDVPAYDEEPSHQDLHFLDDASLCTPLHPNSEGQDPVTRILTNTDSSEPLRPRGDQLMYGNVPIQQPGNMPIQQQEKMPIQMQANMPVQHGENIMTRQHSETVANIAK